EQHIRREKATSNVCTAQVLLAVMSAMYAIYHGPDGLRRIAERIRNLTLVLAEGARRAGWTVANYGIFVTVRLEGGDGAAAAARALDRGYNIRRYEDGADGIALDETTTPAEVVGLLEALGDGMHVDVEALADEGDPQIPAPHART